MSSSNCHALRASWCNGPSKMVFSVVVIPISLAKIDVEEMSAETQFSIAHSRREQRRLA